MRSPRAGLLTLYVPFYESIANLRAEKEACVSSIVGRLAGDAEVIWPGLVDSIEAARRARDLFRQEQVDAIVVVPLVAAFGALGWAAIEEADVPVVLWNIQPSPGIPEPYDMTELIRNSGCLGTEALANTLARAGRFFRTCFSAGHPAVPRRVAVFLRAAAAAADLRRATFGRIGSVFPQMTDVQMDAAEWTARTGSRVAEIPPAEITSACLDQEASAVAARVDEITAAHACENLSSDELARSARLSLALDAIVARHGLDGGAFNCHGENCLRNPEIGVTACYGVSRNTTEGRPFSCTGDLPTAIALYLMKHLAGSAIYGELDFVDPAANAVVIANGGEGDFTAADGEVRMVGNENFAGLHGRGASPKMSPRHGRATLLSFTPLDAAREYRLVVGTGDLVDVPIRGLSVLHQAFRFDGVAADLAFEQWCDAGAVHHLALAPGDWAEELCLAARILKFEFKRIGGKSCG